MTTAPVCHISPAQQISQPAVTLKLRPIPPINMQGNAAAQMASMAQAIAALTYNIQLLTGQLEQRDTGGGGNNQGNGPGGKGGPAPKPPTPPKAASGRWSEGGRATEKVRVVSTEDSRVFVDVIRTNSITMVNSVTGETMTIKS